MDRLVLLPSVQSSSELKSTLASNDVQHLFAVKNQAFHDLLQENLQNGSIQDLMVFECQGTISSKRDVIAEPSKKMLDWIHQHVKANNKVGIMCANGMQRSVPVYAAYMCQYHGKNIVEVMGSLGRDYPSLDIEDPGIYADFVKSLGWSCF